VADKKVRRRIGWPPDPFCVCVVKVVALSKFK